MKKIISLLIVTFLITISYAAPIDPQQAQQIAERYLTQVQNVPLQRGTSQLAHTVYASQNRTATIYLYNVSDGFVVVAADDIAMPILGYSTNGRIEPGRLPDNMRAYLQTLSSQIEQAVAENVAQDENTAVLWRALSTDRVDVAAFRRNATRNAVAPLVATTWDQSPYYNSLCPTISGEQAPTGCIATAMAQLIKYWETPARGRGTHSYFAENANATLSVDFNNATYNFSLMPNELTSTTPANQVNEVAKLMYHCGVAVNMDYDDDESGAQSINARGAFVNYFGFSSDAQLATRSMTYRYTSSSTGFPSTRTETFIETPGWIALLKAELDAGRPMLYSASTAVSTYTTSTGHAFICDGYDNNDNFHFNWGWGGYADGYFSVDAMTPSNYTYSDCHTAIVGLHPIEEGAQEEQVIFFSLDGNSTHTVGSSAIITHPFGLNSYDGVDFSNAFNDQLVLYPENEGDQLFVDFTEYNRQSISIYDGVGTNGTPMVELSTGSWGYVSGDPDFQGISTQGALTLVYSGNMYYDGFEIAVQSVSCLPVLSAFHANMDARFGTISWDFFQEENYANHNFGYQVEYGPAGFAQGSGTVVTPSTASVTLSSLTPDTDYDVYISYNCVGGNGRNVRLFHFTTPPVTECYEQIGNGTGTTSYFPFTFYGSEHSYSQQIYTAEELQQAGLFAGCSIGSVAFQYLGTSFTADTIVLYLGHTNLDYFDSWGGSFLPFNTLTEVYSGSVTFNGWTSIFLEPDFVWNGEDNIVVAVWRKPQATGIPSSQNFAVYETSDYRAARYYSSNDNFAPDQITDVYDSESWVNNILFCATPSCFRPINLSVTPTQEPHTVSFDWLENGDAQSWIVEYGPAGFEQGSGTTMQVTTHPVQIPLTEMPGTKYDLYVKANCGESTSQWSKTSYREAPEEDCNYQIGNFDYSGDQSLGNSYTYSYYQRIYTNEQIAAMGFTAGQPITSISFYQMNESSGTLEQVKLYMANTTFSTFTNDSTGLWLPITDFQCVYNDALDHQLGWIDIPLDAPFVWDGVSNIALATWVKNPESHYPSLSRTNAYSGVMRYLHSSSLIDVENLTTNGNIGGSNTDIRFCTYSNICKRNYSVTIPEGDSHDFYGTTLTQPGIYSHYQRNEVGCDSLVVVTLKLQNIIYVTTNGSGTRTGDSWANSTKLQEAMEMAALVDPELYSVSIWVKKGTYPGAVDSVNSFVLRQNCHLYGGFNGNEPANYDLSLRNVEGNQTILYGQSARRVLYQAEDFSATANSLIDGFYFRNGVVNNNTPEGGAAYIRKNTTIQNCIFTGNESTISGDESSVSRYGVAIYNNGGTLRDCNIYNNKITLSGSGSSRNVYGVGVYNLAGTVENCTINNNTSVYEGSGNNWNVEGGGIYAQNGSVKNCTITRNSAADGGGVFLMLPLQTDILNMDSTLQYCTIANNTARNSGGGVYVMGEEEGSIWNVNVDVTLHHCHIGNNSASASGGGLFYYMDVWRNLTAKLSLSSCNIVRNSGGGLYMENEEAECTVINSIVWGNKLANSYNQMSGEGRYKLVHSAVQGGYSGEGTIALKAENSGTGFGYPEFTNPTAEAGVDATNLIGDWTLQSNSSCINLGVNDSLTVDVDLAGNARVQQGTVDIGCYESAYEIPYPLHPQEEYNIIYVTPEGAGTQDGSSWSNATPMLQYAMDYASGLEPTPAVWVKQGTYVGNFIVQPKVNVYGSFVGNEPPTYDLSQRTFTNSSILDGDSVALVLNQTTEFAENQSYRIDGFTIRRGYVENLGYDWEDPDYGAGGAQLLNAGTIANCSFVNSRGYGLKATNCRIEDCQFMNNTSGVYLNNSTIIRSVMADHLDNGVTAENNSQVLDCQIYNNGRFGINSKNGKISHCLIKKNGRIYLKNNDMFNTSFVNNIGSVDSWGYPSGLIEIYGGVTVNTLFANNQISIQPRSQAKFVNCDFVNNYGVSNSSADNEYTNCISWGNHDGSTATNMVGQTAVVTYSAIEGGYDGTANIPLSSSNTGNEAGVNYPRFINPTSSVSDTTSSYNWQIGTGSACINLGNPNTTSLNLPLYDLADSLRVRQGRLDIGAYEYGPVNEFHLNDSICLGESYFYGDYFVYPEVPGLFEDTIIYYENGLDYVAYLHLVVNEVYNHNISQTICDGDSYLFNGQQLTEAGVYTAYLQSVQGCDSIVVLQLNVQPLQTTEFSATACNSYTWNEQTYTQSGDYTQQFDTDFGCDSLVILHLTIHYSDTTEFDQTACGSHTWNGMVYTQSGDYTQNLQTIHGCDSIVTMHLTLYSLVTTQTSATACDSYTWNGQTYTQSGSYVQHLETIHGCDSAVTLNLIVNHSVETAFSAASCDSYTWNDSIYTQSGDYVQEFATVHGCDSTVTLYLTIHNSIETEFTEVACDSYTWNNSTYTQSGDYVQEFATIHGCDSLVTLHLTVNYSDTAYVTDTICYGLPYEGFDFTLSADSIETLIAANPGVYTFGFSKLDVSAVGCDSTTTLTLTVIPATTPTISVDGIVTACESGTATLSLEGTYSTYAWSTGETTPTISVTQAGFYSAVLTDAHGCSFTTEMLHLGASELITETPNICMVGLTADNHNLVVWERMTDPDVVAYNIYRENNQANIYELLATVPATASNSYEDLTSDPDVRAYRYKISAVDTCGGESSLSPFHKTTHLTINRGIGNSWNLIWSHYEGFEFPSYKLYRGTTPETMELIETMPSNLNSYTDGDNVNGALFYQIEVVMEHSCTEYRDVVYTGAKSNIVHNGEDTHVEITASACESYTYGAETYFASGDYEQTIPTTFGFDSLVTIHLTIHHGDTTYLTAEVGLGNGYQGYGFDIAADALPAEGSYSFGRTLTTVHGCDSLVVLTIDVVNTDNIEENSAASLQLFPNPTADNVRVSSDGKLMEAIEVYDAYGKLLQSIKVEGVEQIVELRRYSAGVYFLRIRLADNTFATKRVVKR